MTKFYNLRFIPILTVIWSLAASQWLLAQTPTKFWDKRFGGTTSDIGELALQTMDSKFLLVGNSESAVGGDKTQASRGLVDFWVVKIDPVGVKIWDYRFGGLGNDYCNTAIRTVDGGFLLAGKSASGVSGDKSEDLRGVEDFWVVKLDASGNKQWDKRFGGTASDVCNSVIASSDGGYLLAGSSQSGANGDKSEAARGSNDYWVVKIDANGNKLWDKTFGGSADDKCNVIVAAQNGGFLLAGTSSSGADGDKTGASRGGFDYWAVNIDANGAKLWDKTFGGSANEECWSALGFGVNGFVLTGHSNSNISGDKTQNSRGGYDYWAVKLDPNGAKLWDYRYGSSSDDFCEADATTQFGTIVMAGRSAGGINGDKTEATRGLNDYWALKIDQTGFKFWDKRVGGSDEDKCANITFIDEGGFLLVGQSISNASGDKTQNRYGGSSPAYPDLWVTRISNSPPTNITISKNNIDENKPPNSLIGDLASVDVDAGDAFSYALVPGTGATDNNLFKIIGNSLYIKISANYEVKSTYTVRIRTTDLINFVYEKAFTIIINNVYETPFIADQTIGPIPENSLANGELADTVIAFGETGMVYSILSGNTGGAFQINPATGELIVANATALDFETNPFFYLTVQVSEGGDNAQAVVTVVIENVNEGPKDIFLSKEIIDENVPAFSIVGIFTTDDTAAVSYAFIPGPGDNNALFAIDGDQLKINISPDFETQSAYSIYVRATNIYGHFFEKKFTIGITDRIFVAFAAPASTVNLTEGNSGYQTVPVTVTLTEGVVFPITVQLAPGGNAIYSNSYGADWWMTGTGVTINNTGATIVFNANGSKTVNLIVYGDLNIENDEGAVVQLKSQSPDVVVSGDTTRLTIIFNDDFATSAKLDFSALTPSIATPEGASGTKLVPIKVTLANANTFPVTAQISYSGTALFGNTYGKDFHLTGLNNLQQLVFTANGTKYFNVVVMGDVVVEPDEIVILALSSPNAVVTDDERRVTIQNDDSPRLGDSGDDSAVLVSVYPNPTGNRFNLSIAAANASTAEIQIVDINGRIVLSQQTDLIEGRNLLEFDLANEAAGLYQVVVSTAERRYSCKIVKQ